MTPSHLYPVIQIIYNPNSTGDGESMARGLEHALQERLPKQAIRVTPTDHAGHAEAMAYDTARAHPGALLVSASGDGGYHELINGVFRAGGQAITSLLPAGNANDHHRETTGHSLVDDIVAHATRTIDVLKLEARVDGKPFVRYAHSYIGIGLTPKVGRELNRTALNRLKEVWIVAKTLLFLRPTTIVEGGVRRSYDSLVCTNISTMSKLFEIASDAQPDDGRFDVSAFRRRDRHRLFGLMLRASLSGIPADRQTDHLSFDTLRPTLIQLDGEVYTLDARSTATITSAHKALECIV